MDENTLLSQRAECGDLEGVRLYLKRGADPEAYNNEPFRRACKNNHLPIVKLLIQSGVDVNREKNLGFEYALEEQHIDVLDYLMFDPELVASGNYVDINQLLETGSPTKRRSLSRVVESENATKVVEYLLPRMNREKLQSIKKDLLMMIVRPTSFGRVEPAHILLDYLQPSEWDINDACDNYKKDGYPIGHLSAIKDYITISKERQKLLQIDMVGTNKRFKL